MNDLQAKIDNIVENERSKQEKIKELQYLRSKLLGNLHILENYIDQIDYCLYNLKKE